MATLTLLSTPRTIQRTWGMHMTLRPLSSSALRYKQESRVHPSYSYLHVHPRKDDGPMKYAVSFLSSNDFPSSSSLFDHPNLIIGWTTEQFKLDPKTFENGDTFVDFMSEVLAKNIHKVNDSTLKGLAQWQKEGWLHIGDERNPPPWGRIPFPEDIIGSVLVKDGVIQPNTYQPMPAHRLVTANGLFQLSEPVRQCVTEAAKTEAQKSA